MEFESKLLRDEIPDQAPDSGQVEQLQEQNYDLLRAVDQLRSAVENLGADIRLYHGEEVEEALFTGLTSKSTALTHLQKSLQFRPWDPEQIRASLDNGIAEIKKAQKAGTEFERKLAAK